MKKKNPYCSGSKSKGLTFEQATKGLLKNVRKMRYEPDYLCFDTPDHRIAKKMEALVNE